MRQIQRYGFILSGTQVLVKILTAQLLIRAAQVARASQSLLYLSA